MMLLSLSPRVGVDRLSVLPSLPFPEHYVITSLLPPPLPLPPFNGLCHVTHEGVFWGLPTLQALSQQNTHTVETRARVCYGVKWTVARGSPITGGHSDFVFRLRLCFAGRRSARVSTLRLEGKIVVARCLGFWSVGDWCLH